MMKERIGQEAIYVGSDKRRQGERCTVRNVGNFNTGDANTFTVCLEFTELNQHLSRVIHADDLVFLDELQYKRLTLAIDFDDTVAHNDYPAIKGLLDGAKEYINRLHDDGHYLIIWTCRCGNPQYMAEHFLYENGIRYHNINRHNPKAMLQYGNDTRKIWADVYIDDKNLHTLPAWRDIYRMVLYKAIMEHRKEEQKKSIQNSYTRLRPSWIRDITGMGISFNLKDFKLGRGKVAAV